MVQKWELLYDRMICEIEPCHHNGLPEQDRAGQVYNIALKFWQQVKAEMKDYQFKNQDEEINFYKSVKPKFTGYIQYLMLVNHGLIFIPHESKEAEQIYWQYEVERLDRFIHRNKAFVAYYKSGSTEHDEKYFLPVEEDSVHKILKVYDLDGDFLTSHDHLVASLLAEEKYNEFAKKRLNQSLKGN